MVLPFRLSVGECTQIYRVRRERQAIFDGFYKKRVKNFRGTPGKCLPAKKPGGQATASVEMSARTIKVFRAYSP
jgi:hypothetical protein